MNLHSYGGIGWTIKALRCCDSNLDLAAQEAQDLAKLKAP